jgi:hypothetical protein
LKTGNMFENSDNHILVVTVNSCIKSDGTLTMGKGAAKQLADKFPGIAAEAARHINHMDLFGFKMIEYAGRYHGLFQTKTDWRQPSTMSLIITATEMLRDNASVRPDGMPLRLNFPGIGCGDLAHRRGEILEIISMLPDNVEVWEYK